MTDIVRLPIAAFYAGLLGLLLIALSIAVIRVRRRESVALLDGGFPDLIRAMRAHGNFVEYAPIALLFMALLELNGAPAAALHGLGAVLLGGRLAHAYAITYSDLRARVAGMIATFTVLGLGSVGLIAQSLFGR